MNYIRHFRWLVPAALLPALVFGAAGCHHKSPTVGYQPLAPISDRSDASSARPVHPAAGGHDTAAASAGTAPVNSQIEARGRAVSTEVGLASWYGPQYNTHKAADGSVYDQNAMTAAHRELPLGSIVRVTNLTNNQSVVVRITDRGPFVDGRIIDLSLAAAKAVDIYRPGTAKVRVEAFAPPAGSDPAGRWCVQVGAFLDQADAIQLKNDLLRRYTSAKVIEFAGPTGYWVRIDPKYDDRATANEVAGSIHIPDPGAQPYLVRLN